MMLREVAVLDDCFSCCFLFPDRLKLYFGEVAW